MAPSPALATPPAQSPLTSSPPHTPRYPYLPGHDPTAPPPGLFDARFDSPGSPGSDRGSGGTTPRRPPRRRPVPFPDYRFHPPHHHREAPTAAELAGRERQRAAQLAADLAPTTGSPQERAARAWLHSQNTLLDAVPFEQPPQPDTLVVRDPEELAMLRRLERRGLDPGVGLETLELDPASDDDDFIRAPRSHTRSASHSGHGHRGSLRRRPLMPLLRTRASSDPLSPVGTPPPSYACAMRDRAPAYPFPAAPYNPYGTPPVMPLNLPAPEWDVPGACSPEGIPLAAHDRVPGYAEENERAERRRGRSWGWKRRRRRPGAHSFMESVLAATT